MAVRWDPSSTLQLCNDNRCVGWAPSRGRKCRNPIRSKNAEAMDKLMIAMSIRTPDPEALQPMLVKMAQLGLCQRNHQYYIDEMVNKWTRLMRISSEIMQPREMLRTAPPGSAPSFFRADVARLVAQSMNNVEATRDDIALLPETSANTRSRHQALNNSETTVISSSSRTVSRSATASHLSIEMADLRISDVVLHQPPASISTLTQHRVGDISPDQPSPTSASLREVHSTRPQRPQPTVSVSTALSTGTPSRSERNDSSLPQTALSSNIHDQASSSLSSDTLSPSSSSESGPPSLQARSTLPCTRTHARRRLIEDECPICYGPMDASSELAWCKSTCGRSVHVSCLEEWRVHSDVGEDRPLRCMLCRANWTDDCDCTGGCLKEHVHKKPLERNCPICLEDMRNAYTEDGESALVWCKTSCGKSVHRDCFDTWRETLEEQDMAATCTQCRAVWVDECEC